MMKIGYKVEGKTDVGFLQGLKKRWCPHAELVEERSRFTGLKKAEIRKLCVSLDTKGCDYWVFLNDADTNDEAEWRRQLTEFRNAIPDEYRHRVIIGLSMRTIECWLCADADWIAGKTGRQPNEFRVRDPKGVLEGTLENLEISDLVKEAPLRNWYRNSASFKEFYDNIFAFSRNATCQIENIR
jgi:hypothetical protein